MGDWTFFVAGIIGGMLGSQLKEGGIELPRLVRENGSKVIRFSLGGIIGLAVGGLAGMYFDDTIWNAATYGFAATALLENGAVKLLPKKE